MSVPLTEKLIQRQINHWNSLRRFLENRTTSDPPPRHPIITISRQTGAGGRTLARNLAERLGLQLHDRSLVERIARDSSLESSMVAELDETEMNQARLWVRGVLNQKIFLRDQYHLALVKTVTTLAAGSGGVFLGRGANHILGSHADLRVRLVAPLSTRVDRIRRESDLSKAEARALIETTDRRRREYIKQVFRCSAGKVENFDLTINTQRLAPETVLELVLLSLLEGIRGDPDGFLTPEQMARG